MDSTALTMSHFFVSDKVDPWKKMKTYQVKVIPRSSKKQVIEMSSDVLKVKITAPPVDGKGNEALIELLSKHFKVRKSAIRILKGKKAQNKMIEIDA